MLPPTENDDSERYAYGMENTLFRGKNQPVHIFHSEPLVGKDTKYKSKVEYKMKLSSVVTVLLSPLLFAASVQALPAGFVDEPFSKITNAISTVFVPNALNDGKHMMFTARKDGKINVIEDPDNSDESREILDISDKVCDNSERGLESILAHPNFEKNRWLYLFYTTYRDGCLEDEKKGPRNRLSRMKVKANNEIDKSSEQTLFETSPNAKGETLCNALTREIFFLSSTFHPLLFFWNAHRPSQRWCHGLWQRRYAVDMLG